MSSQGVDFTVVVHACRALSEKAEHQQDPAAGGHDSDNTSCSKEEEEEKEKEEEEENSCCPEMCVLGDSESDRPKL